MAYAPGQNTLRVQQSKSIGIAESDDFVPDEWQPAMSFLCGLTKYQPGERLTASLAIQHPFIKLADRYRSEMSTIKKPTKLARVSSRKGLRHLEINTSNFRSCLKDRFDFRSGLGRESWKSKTSLDIELLVSMPAPRGGWVFIFQPSHWCSKKRLEPRGSSHTY